MAPARVGCRVARWAALLALTHLLLTPVVIVFGMWLGLSPPNDPHQAIKHAAGEALAGAYFLPVLLADRAGVPVPKELVILAPANTAGWCVLGAPVVIVWCRMRRCGSAEPRAAPDAGRG